MVKRFVIPFAVVGFLVPAWDYVYNFAPISSLLLRGLLSRAYVGLRWPALWHGSSWIVPLVVLVLGPINAAVYGVAGFVLGRALRCLPSSTQGPKDYKVVKRSVIGFAAVRAFLLVSD